MTFYRLKAHARQMTVTKECSHMKRVRELIRIGSESYGRPNCTLTCEDDQWEIKEHNTESE